jgi:hypothetical protein
MVNINKLTNVENTATVVNIRLARRRHSFIGSWRTTISSGAFAAAHLVDGSILRAEAAADPRVPILSVLDGVAISIWLTALPQNLVMIVTQDFPNSGLCVIERSARVLRAL